MRELGNRVKIVARGEIIGKELDHNGETVYKIQLDNHHLAWVSSEEIVEENNEYVSVRYSRGGNS